MTDYLLAVCTSGHIIDSDKTEDIAIQQMELEETTTVNDLAQPNYTVGKRYCPDCGGKILTACPECGNTIKTDRINPPSLPSESTLPDFCYGCGVAYPWIETVEAEKQREGDFIELDDSEIDGHFYPGLVYEINLCYQVQADQAVLVLNRKLIENLIADILRSVFRMDRLDLYFDKDNNRIHALSKLVENMKSERAELQKYGNIDEAFFRTVEDLRYRGDASAHSIEEDSQKKSIREIRPSYNSGKDFVPTSR